METTTSDRTTATVTIDPDGRVEIVVGDRTEVIRESSVEGARAAAISLVAAHATLLDTPIAMTCTDPSGVTKLLVNKDGSVHEAPRTTANDVVLEGSISPSDREAAWAAATARAEAAEEALRASRGEWSPRGASEAPAPRSAATTPSAGVTEAPAPVETPAPSPVAEAPRVTPTTRAAAAEEARPMRAATTPSAGVTEAPAPVETPAPSPVAEAPRVTPTTRAAAAEEARPMRETAAQTTERPGTPRRSFIEEDAPQARAEQGFRGVLAKMGFNVAPSAAEAAEREDVARVSRHWAGPRTIAIVNGKGGASKTPTTAMLSAVFARNGGSGVLAWDNNETRGTLGWRTEQAQHDATVQNLLPYAETLMSAEAQASDLTNFLHHQLADKYDVLRSNPNILAEDQRLTMEEFDAIHAVAAKYFRLMFIDSGNDESADRWRRMIDRADQIVIATTARGEHAEAGALLLEALRDRGEHAADLARNAVVVVSQADHKGGVAAAQRVADGFRPMARATAVIPFDRSMRAGRLTFDALEPDTQRAWLAAASAVAAGL
ncbi:MinD/ParA family ATP-binding protein [Microbacterium gorillae]|uniref:MinD/ParA family ATP-binding protein n=1 Tax=Microbacterium gorillae TaxID=1231063 RepID=UPI00069477C3|nr:AAA family ATPase [Microbacterium gorillae]